MWRKAAGLRAQGLERGGGVAAHVEEVGKWVMTRRVGRRVALQRLAKFLQAEEVDRNYYENSDSSGP